MTTTEHAAQIRQTLKARYGWTSRDVSVRADYYSMGSAIRIRVKNPAVSIKAVEAIAEPSESIDRDQWGEILNGGNRYVTVSYDSDTREAIGRPYLSAVEVALVELKAASDNSLIPVEGTPYMVGKAYGGWGVAIWEHTKGHRQDVSDAAGAAQWIGVAMVPNPMALEAMPCVAGVQ